MYRITVLVIHGYIHRSQMFCAKNISFTVLNLIFVACASSENYFTMKFPDLQDYYMYVYM